MNNKKIGIIFGVILLIALIGGIIVSVVSCQIQDNNWKYQHRSITQENTVTVDKAYYLQNYSFQIYYGNTEIYRPYSDINEDWLQHALNFYNASTTRTGETLSLQDVKDYLSSETNADGSPRTYLNCNNQKIWDFLDWGGENYYFSFTYDAQTILDDYSKTHPAYAGKNVDDLTDDKYAAITYKLYNPDYNLDLDNPDSWKALNSASSVVG